MTVVYLISRILTYPAAYLKGFWEHWTCRILKVQVLRGGYLRSDEYCGHIEHAPAQSPGKAFLLVFLPWLAQKLLALLCLTAAAVPLLVFGLRGSSETIFFWVEVVLLYLGVSFLCNAYPIWGDAKNLWRLFYAPKAQDDAPEAEKPKKASLLARILLAPINVSFMACAWLERFGLQILLWFGLAVALYLLR